MRKIESFNIRYTETKQPNPFGTDRTYYIFEVYRKTWIFGKKKWKHSITTDNYEEGLQVSQKISRG